MARSDENRLNNERRFIYGGALLGQTSFVPRARSNRHSTTRSGVLWTIAPDFLKAQAVFFRLPGRGNRSDKLGRFRSRTDVAGARADQVGGSVLFGGMSDPADSAADCEQEQRRFLRQSVGPG